MSDSGSRVSGYRISSNQEDLDRVSGEMSDTFTRKNGSVVEKVTKPNEVSNMIQKVFKDSEGLVLLDSMEYAKANKIIFAKKAIERTGGDSLIKDFDPTGKHEKGVERRSEIPDCGNWYHTGANNEDYRAEIPLDIFRENREGKRTTEIFAGGLGTFMLNVQGSIAQNKAFTMSVSTMFLSCLNGMVGSHTLFQASHKHTSKLDIYEVLKKGLKNASLNYGSLNSDYNNLKNAEVTPEKLGMFFHSGIMNGILSGSNVKEITNYFQETEKYKNWFDNKDLNGLRLYNAVTLFGERQRSPEVKNKLAGKIYYPLSDAGIVPLPKTCSFPSNFKMLNVQPVSDSGIIPDERQIDLEGIPFQETVETEMVS